MPLSVCNLSNIGLSVDFDLPVSFKYIPYVPKKRTSTKRTANAVVTQAAFPTQIVHGDGFLPWTVEDLRLNEFEDLFALYNTGTQIEYVFTGYWNDAFDVYFTELNVERVFGRLMSIRGEFQVLAINGAYEPYTGLDCET